MHLQASGLLYHSNVATVCQGFLKLTVEEMLLYLQCPSNSLCFCNSLEGIYLKNLGLTTFFLSHLSQKHYFSKYLQRSHYSSKLFFLTYLLIGIMISLKDMTKVEYAK